MLSCMYSIHEYDNVFFFLSLLSHNSITAELHSTFTINERNILLLMPDGITFVGVLHAIRAVAPGGVQKRLNIK